jgi:hypothetical protein
VYLACGQNSLIYRILQDCSAGVFCAVVSQPADNMVSMLSANPKATMGSVIKDMGLMNLAVRGLPLRILMVGTLTGLQWGIYDAYKVCSWSSLGGIARVFGHLEMSLP